jgi:hypothetical protein
MTNIPLFKGRPIILFPDGWDKGWKEEGNFDTNGELSRNWSRVTWKEYRNDYYDGHMFSPFGFDTSVPHAWPGVPYAPHGMSTQGVPKLHPDDE